MFDLTFVFYCFLCLFIVAKTYTHDGLSTFCDQNQYLFNSTVMFIELRKKKNLKPEFLLQTVV